jgi:adenylate kinase
LIERGYEEEKVMENVEAELVDVILIEAVERCEDVYEIDTSEMSISEVADIVEQILKGEEVKNRYRPGKVDWLSKLEDRLDEVARW